MVSVYVKKKLIMQNRFFEKPILNSPYHYPARQWELDFSGQPTQKIIEARRRAEFIFDKLGRIPVLKARMNADLHMADGPKNTGKGSLFVIFGKPDRRRTNTNQGQLRDGFHLNTEVRSDRKKASSSVTPTFSVRTIP